MKEVRKWELVVVETIMFLLDKDADQCATISDLAQEKSEMLKAREEFLHADC